MRRRVLHFSDLSEVVDDVGRLAPAHRTLGNWSLAQIARHLADSVNASIDGFDLRRHRLKRFFLAKPMLWVTFRFGIPPGYTVDPSLAPPADARLNDSIRALSEAVERYRAHTGPLKPHPLFANLPRPVWDRFHCFHCAHHLSFVIPPDPSPCQGEGQG